MLLSLGYLSLLASLTSAAPTWERPETLYTRDDSSIARAEPAYQSCMSHPDQKKCQPVTINYLFEATVPVLVDSIGDVPSFNYGGLHFKLPRGAFSGLLVSFFGNFEANQTTSSQVQMVDLNTTTSSTSVVGGESMSNGTAMANSTTLVAYTFSSGNASSAVAAAQQSGSVTSTSSSGDADSSAVAVADAAGVVSITTSANTTDAANAQSLQNAQQAAAATSCVAQNEGATAEAEQITTVQFTTDNGTTVTSIAYAACAAGLVAPSEVNSTSSSGSMASVNGVSATVICDGVESTNERQSTTFRIAVLGVWSPLKGFAGAITGQRVADVEASC